MNIDENGSLMGPGQVAKYLGFAERTVLLWAQQGKIPAFKLGSLWRFRKAELDKWMEGTRSGPSFDDIEPITPRIEPSRSKWRIKKDEDEAEKALISACKAYIETTIQSVEREVFVIEQFEDRFGVDIAKIAIDKLIKEKKIQKQEHEGLDGEKVKVIIGRS